MIMNVAPIAVGYELLFIFTLGVCSGFFLGRFTYKATPEDEEYVKKLETEVKRLQPKRRPHIIATGGEDIF